MTLDLLSAVLHDGDDLHQCIVRHVGQQRDAATGHDELDRLCRERDDLARRVQLIVRSLDEDSLADAKVELDRLSRQRRDLDQKIAEAEQRVAWQEVDPEQIAAEVLKRIDNLADEMPSLPRAALRELLAAFIERIEVDMQTREAEVWLKLSSDMLAVGEQAMRPDASSPWSTSYQTQYASVIEIGRALCRYTRTPNAPCYRCRRLKDAA